MSTPGGSSALYGLTEQQRARCDQILAESRTYQHVYAGSPNHYMEGWSVYRVPSTRNPPHLVLLRYRDTNGQILAEYDVS